MRQVKSMAGSSVERKRKRKKGVRDVGTDKTGDSESDAERNDEEYDDDYLDFIQNIFLGVEDNQIKSVEAKDDDEADPEYNIKEDEEEHDKEELRRDPGVKIPKKEIIELLAELESDPSVFQAVTKAFIEPKNYGGVPLHQQQEQQQQQQQQQQQLEEVSSALSRCLEEGLGVCQKVEEIVVPEPLISDEVRDKIKYQLQQHVQLLAQTYALTVISPKEEDRALASQSKKMIIELHSFANSYGPWSNFRVKNVHHAAYLVNTWPAPGVSKSPIKKKILEERYRNQQKHIYGGNGLQFSREVVKKIAESPAFMYAQLLPVYPHLHSEYKINFTPSEDALIAIGHKEMQEKSYDGLKTRQKAKLIAELLLPGRPLIQIFHRIKNARKADKNPKDKENHGLQVLRKYLLEGIRPPSPLDSWSPELMKTECVPPIDQPELPPTWLSLLQKLRLEVFDENVATTSVKRPRGKKVARIEEIEGKPKTPNNRSKSLQPLNENKLSGTGMIIPDLTPAEETTEDVERIPVYGNNGTPAAFVVIPKRFLGNAASEKDANNNSDTSADRPISDSLISATPIGEPFNLPQSFQSENVQGAGAIIDLQTIDSPLKREIFQMATGESVQKDQTSTVRGRRKPSDSPNENNKRKKPRKSVDTSDRSPVVDKPIANDSAPVCSDINSEKSSRENHSARTWVYQRKSAAELAAAVERKLGLKKKSRSKRAGAASPKPEPVIFNIAGSSDEDDASAFSPGPSFNSRMGVVGLSVPSLDIATPQKSRPLGPTNEPLPGNGSGPADSGDQRTTSDNGNGQSGDKSGKSSNSSARPNRGSKRERTTPGNGDGDGEDEPPDRHQPPLSKGDDDGDHREEETDDEGEEKESPDSSAVSKVATKPISAPKKAENPSKNPKKFKRSPQTKKRMAKYKTEQIQKLLDEADSEVNVEEIETAFAEEFWTKCQHTLDPVLYNNLVQVFCDFGEKNTDEDEIFGKVEEMLKDHPDLLIDLATMIEPQLLQKNNLLKDNYVIQAYIRFMHLLEKLTLQCPQLRTRVLQKLRGLRDLEKVTEQDVLELVDLYFQGNPIMTDALKAMFPAIFPPQSTVRAEDFEEINLDDDSLNQSEEGMATETVILPEETNVPATSTCPCECHSNVQSVTYQTKVRHCRKCCIKFQDGKVFMHSGRFMKQVNIEYTTREKAEEILAGRACSHCFEPLKAFSKAKSPKKTPKKRPAAARPKPTMSECESETEVRPSTSTTSAKQFKSSDFAKNEMSSPVHPRQEPTAAPPSKALESEDIEEGEIVDEDDTTNDTKDPKPKPVLDSPKPATSLSSIAVHNKSPKRFPTEQSMNIKTWSYEEDRILLQTLQQEGPSPTTFEKIVKSKSLPGRSLEEIQERFNELLRMIQRVQEQEKKSSR